MIIRERVKGREVVEMMIIIIMQAVQMMMKMMMMMIMITMMMMMTLLVVLVEWPRYGFTGFFYDLPKSARVSKHRCNNNDDLVVCSIYIGC